MAKRLSEHFKNVIATDISEEQLSFAPQKANIEYRKASAEDSGLPANQFDLITVAQAIHWFDFDQFYQEVLRVAQDGALLAVIGYGMVRINEKLNPIIDNLYEEAFQAHFDKNRNYLDEEYRTIPFPFEEIQAPSFQNTLNWSLVQLEGYFNTWSAIQKMKETEEYNPANKTIKKLEKTISDPQNITAAFPVFMRLAKIKKK